METREDSNNRKKATKSIENSYLSHGLIECLKSRAPHSIAGSGSGSGSVKSICSTSSECVDVNSHFWRGCPRLHVAMMSEYVWPR